ncbi:thioredoxin domain-containing protein 17 [Anabrus simplex]|uniref:thioredoxin domain-containing protein 17 n=1 Tax=Anabrus simplex TaxID=316456 RepID=UPI0034DDA78B
MVKTHAVEGYVKYSELIQSLQADKKTAGDIFVLFSGSKDENGESWCPDCVKAMPVIEAALGEADKNAHFIYVGVGSRDSWKDPNSPFRKDPKLKLRYVPTLIAWGRPDRLEDAECANSDLLKMVFNPDG